MLTTDQKGAVAESAVVHEALKLGLGVYRPLVDGGRSDLILEVGRDLFRAVQVSKAVRRRRKGVLLVDSARTRGLAEEDVQSERGGLDRRLLP